MDKNSVWKWLILVALVAGSLFVLRDGVHLGLDLKGGSSWTVQIARDKIVENLRERHPDLSDEEIQKKTNKTMEDASIRALEVLRNRVDPFGTKEAILYQGKDNRITVQLPGIDETERKRVEIDMSREAFLEFSLVHEDNMRLVGELFADNLAPEGYDIVNLEGRNFYRHDSSGVDKSTPEYMEKLRRFNAPTGYNFMLEKRDVAEQTVYMPFFVKRRYEMTGEFLERAAPGLDTIKGNVVNIWFDAQGKKTFAKITSDYAPGGPRNPQTDPTRPRFRQLAIVLDGVLHSAPSINEPIFGGTAEISGSFATSEARYLSKILNAGSLPAPIRIVEKRVVAPSLGVDSIRSGIRAVLYGGIGVVVFMIIYYSVCGVVADLALLLNMIILPLGMVMAAGFMGIFASDASMGSVSKLPVLTLPGIAGILLTIGMAVDANVLIFERIREESAAGKRLWTAITAGYDRAFITIVDANTTTLLTGIILFIFGSGPVRGFAVTLCAGIMASMFTALVVTKLFFEVLVTKTTIKSLKMMSVIGATAFDFVGFRKIAGFTSIAIIVGSCAFMGIKANSRPGDVFGVDFLGGSALTFSIDAKVPIKEFKKQYPVMNIRNAMEAAGLQELHIQYQEEMDSDAGYLQIKTGSENIDGKNPSLILQNTLSKDFPEAKFVLEQEDEVGPQVGRELIKKAISSISLALLMIIAYLSWRFELGFAIGAIVALIHDVLVTVGIYSLMGYQLSLPIVAALLTIVGYSVNDTIVVFDRIREDIKLIRSKSFSEICNLSINQTLSRTLLTSLTTLITVVMLLVFGGGAIHDFALALCIGVVVGTYSSIFVATPVVLSWYRGRKPDFGKPN